MSSPEECLQGCSRSSPSEVFLGKGVLKIYSRLTGEHSCRSVISIKLQRKFIEIILRHGCSPVNLLFIFRTLFPKNISGRLLLLCVNFLESVDVKAYCPCNCFHRSELTSNFRATRFCRANTLQTDNMPV